MVGWLSSANIGSQVSSISREVISQALRQVLPSRPGIAVIHSSLSALVPPGAFTRWDILAAIDGLVGEGWTIALPAFTFSFCGGKPFDLQSSQSEVGVLADWCLDGLPGAMRTSHPIYSFVVVGPEASTIAGLSSKTTFGEGSPFEFFEQHDAALVMLGCGWRFCTQFHRYEELASVPYRYFKDFSGRVRVAAADEAVIARMYVRDLKIDARNDFSPIVDTLRQAGAIKTQDIWRGIVECASVSDVARVANAQLASNPLSHVTDPARVKYRLAKLKEAASNPPLKVAVLGHANLEILKSKIEAELEALLPERRIELYAAPFGQLPQEVLDPSSGLAQFAPDISIFADRVEDLFGTSSIEGIDAAVLEDRVAGYGDMILRHCAAFKGPTFVFRFALAYTPFSAAALDAPALIDGLNRTLHDKLAAVQPVWIDVASEAARCAGPAHDSRLWLLGRFPFSDAMTKRLARRCAGLMLAVIGKTARVIVTDLDNTLWGGVLGEDGIDGLQIGGDHPGNAFAEFQRNLKQLAGRGIALAIASKNDTDLALKALDEHPAMEIRTGDIVAHRINWLPKWTNIPEICEELSLGLESVLFIDDNPVEREAVRRNLPGVKILDLPEDPASYSTALSECPWIAVTSITAEDIKRVKSYRIRAKIEQERRTAVSLDDFYVSLGMTLGLIPLGPGNIVRAAQLCQKTNQFNTTTRRYDKAALTSIVEMGGDVVVIALQDKHSSVENIGLLILKPHPDRHGWGLVDDFMMSCRVLGRGLERAILHWALAHAKRRGWSGLGGFIIETERNTPVRSVFRDAGFLQELPSTEWIKLTEQAPPLPGYLTIDDQVDFEPQARVRMTQ